MIEFVRPDPMSALDESHQTTMKKRSFSFKLFVFEGLSPRAPCGFRGQPTLVNIKHLKGLILAQNERWRRGLGMQVEREPRVLAPAGTAADGVVIHRLRTLRSGIATGNCD